MVRAVLSTRYVDVPDNVTLTIKARVVTVAGPRGELTRDFRHQNLELTKVGSNKLRIEKWFGTKKELACVRTVSSHIANMIVGVTQGYRYTLRYVYAHFPINVTVNDTTVEIRNFLGEKRVRRITMRGTSVVEKSKAKDTLVIEGNSLDDVSQSAADIQQICRVRNKDIRKFLDGIYVSESGPIPVEDN